MINFFTEELDFSLGNQEEIRLWIESLCSGYDADIQMINYVFCSDDYLLDINKEHLNHDYYTDIITFDMRDAKGQPIEADIFVSIDRVKDNAKEEGVGFPVELHRVLIHGLLHLIGYSDKTKREAAQMRAQEEKCLSLLLL
jgi:probable rRNA maturation factor